MPTKDQGTTDDGMRPFSFQLRNGNCQVEVVRFLGSIATSSLAEKSWRCVFVFLFFDIHPGNLTWNLQMMVSNRNLLFQGLIFRFHVKLRGSNSFSPFSVLPLGGVKNRQVIFALRMAAGPGAGIPPPEVVGAALHQAKVGSRSSRVAEFGWWILQFL